MCIRDRSYIVLTLINFGGFFFGVYQFYIQHNPILVMMWALTVGFFAVQIGGLIHDAAHRSIFKSVRNNDLYGYFASFINAFPYSVWKVKHNIHHAHVNESEEDPDLQIPFSFTDDRFKGKKGMIGFIRRYQKWLFYPLGSLVSYSIRIKAFGYYLQNLNRQIFFEMILVLTGLFFWYIFPFMIMPLWKALIFLTIVNQSGGFYLLNVFAPNHKGMPQFDKDVKFSFLEHQIVASRNIYGHWLTDYVYLGLNYQIEHHLFPDCPRNSLKRVSPYVQKLCKKYNLPYLQMTPLESNSFILSELDAVAKST